MTSKTISLTGEEIKVEYSGGCNAWLRNDGTAAVYASGAPGISAGADGTVSIPAGGSAPVYGANGTVYLMGTGSAQLIGSDYSTNPFRNSAASGGSGADEQARAAIKEHTENTAIHVTADEKALWNGKADSADIPTKISELTNDSGFINSPDGGNAATLEDHPASDFFQVSAGLRKGTQASDIFSNMSPTHAGWNNFCAIESESAIPDAPESAVPMRYEVWSCGENASRGYQIAVSLFTHKIYIKYLQDGAWSGWYNIADGGSAASVGTYTEAKIAALEARIAALEGK